MREALDCHVYRALLLPRWDPGLSVNEEASLRFARWPQENDKSTELWPRCSVGLITLPLPLGIGWRRENAAVCPSHHEGGHEPKAMLSPTSKKAWHSRKSVVSEKLTSLGWNPSFTTLQYKTEWLSLNPFLVCIHTELWSGFKECHT